MQTFDQHIADLVRCELIDMETAMNFATNPNDFQRNLSFQGSASSLGDGSINSGSSDNQQGSITLEGDNSAPPSFIPAPGKMGVAPIPTAVGKAAPKSIDIIEEGNEPTHSGIPKLPNVA